MSELDLAAAVLEKAAAALRGSEVAVATTRHHAALTRFARSAIHQNVAEDVTTVRVQIHHAGRTASTSATVVDASELDRLVDAAVEAVRVAPEDPGWPGLGPPAAVPSGPPLDKRSVEATPADRAQIVAGFVSGAGGLETAGYCRSTHWSTGLVNSAGQQARGEAFECSLSGIARHGGADGVARHAPLTLGELDGEVLGARAAAKARASADAAEHPPGRYEVVLEPTAVADIVESLAAVGFNGKMVNEQRSFVRVGDDQFDAAVTLVDEPLLVGQTFDAEGTPRQRLALVERGTSRAVTHDRRSAAEAGATSTGHALDVPFVLGPIARHLSLAPATDAAGTADEVEGPLADSAVAELVADVEFGVLVSEFWYTRMLDPRALAITGLTRNGVWLIEHGTVTRPLQNLRFTQSYAQALMPGNVLGVGSAATPIPGDTYMATSPRWTCPALRLASWNFTGNASG